MDMPLPLQEKPVQKREAFLDLLRIAACFLVIVNHTASGVFINRSPQEKVWFVTVAYFLLSKPAVLLFYMISGYLLLGRQDSWKTAWKRIRRILLVLLCCAAVYAVYHGFANDPNSTGREMLREFSNVLHEPPSNALWYLYTYLGLLIILPFLQKMAAGMEKKDYYVLFGLTCVFSGLLPIPVHYNEKWTLAWCFELPLISNAVGMLFAGQYFAKYGIQKTRKGFVIAACLSVAMVLLNTWATWMEYCRNEGADYLFFETRELMPNVIFTVCLFYMASFLRLPVGLQKVVTQVGMCTFGMYLAGDLLLDILAPIHSLLDQRMHLLISLVLYQIIVFLCAFVIIYLVRKIPFIRKLI